MTARFPPPVPPETVPYASRADDNEHLRWSAGRVGPAIVWAVLMVVVTHLALAVIAPRMESILMDFKMELPAPSKLLLSVSRAYRHAYLWLLTTPILIATPLLWLGFATPRPRERLPRLVGTLVVMLLVLWVLLSFLMPLISLYQGIGASTGKK